MVKRWVQRKEGWEEKLGEKVVEKKKAMQAWMLEVKRTLLEQRMETDLPTAQEALKLLSTWDLQLEKPLKVATRVSATV